MVTVTSHWFGGEKKNLLQSTNRELRVGERDQEKGEREGEKKDAMRTVKSEKKQEGRKRRKDEKETLVTVSTMIARPMIPMTTSDEPMVVPQFVSEF